MPTTTPCITILRYIGVYIIMIYDHQLPSTFRTRRKFVLTVDLELYRFCQINLYMSSKYWFHQYSNLTHRP